MIGDVSLRMSSAHAGGRHEADAAGSTAISCSRGVNGSLCMQRTGSLVRKITITGSLHRCNSAARNRRHDATENMCLDGSNTRRSTI
jgi:hypothetical protein